MVTKKSYKTNASKAKCDDEDNGADAFVKKDDDSLKAAEKIYGKFPIVGIGASAGGLAAFEAFFSGMPVDINIGMAFVLVQHLAPDHKSILTELIRRYTRMQVFEVEDGMRVMPNCAYIIPPNRDMALLDGVLQLLEPAVPRGQRLPIDFFFRSLAQDQHERAICIVLSGTGSDGTLGVRAIKGEGGIVIAQDPDSTQYDGMVDYVLPVAEMPRQLMNYAAHAFVKQRQAAYAATPEIENAMKKIFILLREQSGNDFSQYKTSTVYRRIEKRMAMQQIETIEEYVKYMHQSSAEVKELFQDLLIGVTSFFRDREAFKTLEQQGIPNIFAGKQEGATIRVWTPGCSTGEEAYSIAILMKEQAEKLGQDYTVQIFATDIDSHAIAFARSGVYPASIASDISPDRLSRFFSAESDGSTYRINKNVRDMLIFSEQNVIKDPPFSKLDLITCRNFMIYLDKNLQKRLISMFHYALKPRGILFLGSSENIVESEDLFVALDRKSRLFQRQEDYRATQRISEDSLFPFVTAMVPTISGIAAKTVFPVNPSLREITEKALLQQEDMAGVLVNKNGDLLYLHGRTGMYLELAQGESENNNILKMAREGLKHELTTALHKAAAKKELVRCLGLQVKTNDHFTRVNLSISPVEADNSRKYSSPLFLVVLQKAPQSDMLIINQLSTDSEQALKDDGNIELLKQQLRAKEEYLQAANEELETANEELSSSNEEMQSINEELQSTNEELETSKEELQSMNEELATVNTELQTKVVDLSRINNDMNNMLSGTGIGTVFVDLQLHIMRFTPTATKIINLILSDVGRPVAHIVSNLVGYDKLVEDVQTVLDTLVYKEADVQTKDGKWYEMRIHPYRTTENVIEGAVITFVDITELKQAKDALAVSELRFRRLFESAKDGILILDAETGNIEGVNQYLIDLLGYTEEQIIKKKIWDLGFFRDIIDNKEKFLELQQNEYIRYDDLPLETADGRQIEVEFISSVYTVNKNKVIQCDIRDISERRREEGVHNE